MQLFKKQKYFLNFLQHLGNLHQILNILNLKMTLTADLFSKLWTAKDVVT